MYIYIYIYIYIYLYKQVPARPWCAAPPNVNIPIKWHSTHTNRRGRLHSWLEQACIRVKSLDSNIALLQRRPTFLRCDIPVIKIKISFAEYSLFYRALLQKRRRFVGRLLILLSSDLTGLDSNVVCRMPGISHHSSVALLQRVSRHTNEVTQHP